MNSVAVCINCGKGKAAPFDKCRACGFLPRLEDDLVKSIYLSTGRYDTPEEQISYLSELEQASRALMAGYSVRFVPEELVRLRQKRLADEPLTVVLRIIRPAIIVLAVLLLLPWIVRAVLK